MIKLKDNVSFTRLKEFGFKIEPERAYYIKDLGETKIIIWKVKNSCYKTRVIYIENIEYEPIAWELDTIYELIKANLVERVIKDEK